MDKFSRARNEYQIIKELFDSEFDKKARDSGLIVDQVAIVASYDSVSKMASVYFPEDITNKSSPYKNCTGEELTVGSKVHIFYKYGDIEQGWIVYK